MSKNKNLRVALAQINTTVGAIDKNAEKIKDFISQAQGLSADIVVFPELAMTGYPPEDLLFKKHFIKQNKSALQKLTKSINKICAVIGFVDMDSRGQLFNAAAIITNKKIQGVYHKCELPNYGVFDEKRYFTPGQQATVFKINGIGVGVNICEDVWVEKSVCQKQVQRGAQVLINLSSSPYDIGKFQKRVSLLRSKAKSLKVYLHYVNLIGGQDELVFDGGSLVVGPDGKVLSAANCFEEALLVSDTSCSAKPNNKTFDFEINFKKDYAIPNTTSSLPTKIKGIECIYKALVLGTRDYIEKNGFNKVIIGISGGIDSALVAKIAVDAVGSQNVIGVTMPSVYTSSGTLCDSHALAQSLGFELKEISIKKLFDQYLVNLKNEFKGTQVNAAEENIQARIRGNILMALSNKFGWLVLTTGNKSELAVGYCTLYGDMSGGFAVLKDVLKTQVYKLAHFCNRDKETIPQRIISRAPSAELRDNQKDQDSLPPYELLDRILVGYVEDHHSVQQLSKKFPADIVSQVVSLIDRNEYKRRQSPPGIKISQRAFGRDWRLPITNQYRISGT